MSTGNKTAAIEAGTTLTASNTCAAMEKYPSSLFDTADVNIRAGDFKASVLKALMTYARSA